MKAVVEAPARSRRVAERTPDDLCICIRHGTFGDFPDHVGDRRRFVKDEQDPIPLIVQSRKGFRMAFVPRDRVDAPRLFMPRFVRKERRRRVGEHLFGEEALIPLR